MYRLLGDISIQHPSTNFYKKIKKSAKTKKALAKHLLFIYNSEYTSANTVIEVIPTIKLPIAGPTIGIHIVIPKTTNE